MPLVLRFGEFTLDPEAGILRRAGDRIPLEPQPARLLTCLAERAGELVTRQQLVECLWGPETHVDYAEGLSYCVRQARLALGDTPRRPRFIETLPRRGYRFLPEVSRRDASARPRLQRRRLWAGLALAAGVAVLVAIVERRPNRHHELALHVIQSVHDVVWSE